VREIQIIGGGLAGLSLGVYLRKHDVVTKLVEAQKMAWWMEDTKIMEDILPTVAWGLSRYKIDQDLAELFVNMGGLLETGNRAVIDDAPGIIWGTGKRKKRGRWIGLKIHVLDANISGLEMHAGKRGYLGLCGVEENRTNCCGLFRVDKSLKGRGSELLGKYLTANGLLNLSHRYSAWEKDEGSFSTTAGFAFGNQEQIGAFCVGDASYLIPPFTGNGMSMALESSWIAGKWLVRYAREEISWAEAVAKYNDECVVFFQKRMRLSGAMHPLLFHRLGRKFLKATAATGMLPFEFLFAQLRTP